MPARARTEIDEHAEIAFGEAMANRTVAIVALPPGCPPSREGLGSGVCLSYRGELFVLTAEHVVKNCGPDNIDILAKSEAPLTRDRRQLRVTERFHPPISEIIVSSVAADDLALLRLKSRPREMRHTDFYAVPTNDTPRRVQKQVGIFGFPYESTREARRGSERGRAVLPYPDFPQVAHVTRPVLRALMRANPPYRPNLHVLLNFPDIPVRSDNSDLLHDPRGLSGCGAWKVSPRGPNDLWISSDVKPVAIVIAYARGRGVLMATRIKRAWRLLQVWERLHA